MLAGVCIFASLAAAPAEDVPAAILDAAGMTGGLIVHLGNDPEFTSGLLRNDSFLVHGLYGVKVGEARKAIAAKGVYGKVSVDAWEGGALPYTNNLVNLIVVSDADPGVSEKELMRVLAPRGLAVIKGGKSGGFEAFGAEAADFSERLPEGWTAFRKPVPEDIDDWTHYLHGPDNNAVSRDSKVAPMYHTQWEGGPRWQRSHDFLASLSALVSNGGRLFYIHDEGERSTIALPSNWVLVARDAFNGIILWKRPIGSWENHLRKFRVGPVDLARRLVAVGDRVYVTLGYGKPVSVLDAATGKTLMEYAGTEGAHEIIVDHGVVYASVIRKSEELIKLEFEALNIRLAGRTRDEAKQANSRLKTYVEENPIEKLIVAVDAGTGEVLWERAESIEKLYLNTLTVGSGFVFYQNGKTVFCLDARKGSVQWSIERPDPGSYATFSSPTLVLHKDVLLWAGKETVEARAVGKMTAYSVEDGKELWSCPSAETFHAPYEVFVMQDVVWTGGVSKSTEPGLTEGRDYKTGEIVCTRPPDPELYEVVGHASCYRNKATERYLLMNRAGIDYIDVKEGKAYSHHFARGACQYGILPANGYMYTTPHSCNCYIYAKLSGYVAASGKRYTVPDTPDRVLEKGSMYGKPPTMNPEPASSDWPTYRGDPQRSSAVKASLPEKPEKEWELELGGTLTQPVAAGGLLYVADRETHTLYAIDHDSGERRWSYIPGGEVDSPPTLVDGMAVFGCADGWVYALDAGTGGLVWRFRAAPKDEKIVSYGALKSLWPVPGNVLVLDGKAYCVAGRTSYMDGGIFLYKLDVKSGERLAVRRIYDRDPETDLEYREVKEVRNLDGALPDILSSDGTSIFLRHRRFDLDLNEQPRDVPHLFSSVGFLDDDWWHRSFWQYGTLVLSGFGGWRTTGNFTISGQLLSFDEAEVYGFGHKIYGNSVYHGVAREQGHYRLFRMPKSNYELSRLKLQSKEEVKDRKAFAAVRKKAFVFGWESRVKLLGRAMILAKDKLVVAGPPDVIADEPLDAELFNQVRVLEKLKKYNDVFTGKHQGILMVFSAKDGAVLSEQELQSPPVFNGMMVAGERLILVDNKGRVLSFK